MCAGLGWTGLLQDPPVPLLSLVDLVMHAAGHVVASPLPSAARSLTGSLFPVVVPLLLAGWLVLRERDHVLPGVVLAWAAAAAGVAAASLADPQFAALTAAGGEHHWVTTLTELGWMRHADTIAVALRALGWLALATGFAEIVAGALRDHRQHPTDPPSVRPRQAVGRLDVHWH